jgi:hypothetical protein
MEQGTIIDDDSDEFKGLDRDEVPICIIFLVKEGMLLERDVPPEA